MIELLWLSSAVGAALFFCAGWLAGRGRRVSATIVRVPEELVPAASLEPYLAAMRAVRPASRPPIEVRAAGQKAGDVLQALVDGLGGSSDVRCAVVADELGLVVASRGELGDELAAVGALFGRAGLEAQKVLPLHRVQRVVVEDDQNVTLTLRPLQTDGTVEGDLALITLAGGTSVGRASRTARSARPV